MLCGRARPCTAWEAMRVQLGTLSRFAEDEELSASVEDLRQKLIELQETMVDLRLTGQGQDGVRFEARLLQKLGYLVGALAIADFQPTDQQVEVKALLREQLEAHLAELEDLVRTDVAALNETLRGLGMLIITDDSP